MNKIRVREWDNHHPYCDWCNHQFRSGEEFYLVEMINGLGEPEDEMICETCLRKAVEEMGMTNEQFDEYKKNLARELELSYKMMASDNEEVRTLGQAQMQKIIADMQAGLQKP
jgi:hypothetical protein